MSMPFPALASRSRRIRLHVVASLVAAFVGTLAAACARRVPNAYVAPAAAEQSAARVEIAAMLDRGAASWNRGDLDAFVGDYTADATYIGRNGMVRGPAAIRATYAPRFAPGVERGALRFENVDVDLLAPGVANVVATYVLTKGDSVIGRGPTSVVLKRLDGRWRIAHDHSS